VTADLLLNGHVPSQRSNRSQFLLLAGNRQQSRLTFGIYAAYCLPLNSVPVLGLRVMPRLTALELFGDFRCALGIGFAIWARRLCNVPVATGELALLTGELALLLFRACLQRRSWSILMECMVTRSAGAKEAINRLAAIYKRLLSNGRLIIGVADKRPTAERAMRNPPAVTTLTPRLYDDADMRHFVSGSRHL
jgi:hypothetical protein